MKITRALAIAGTSLVLAGCQAGPSALEQATQDCLQSGSEWFELRDNGKTVHLQQEGLGLKGLDDEEAECVLKAVDAPESFFTKKANTSAASGEQSASWDGYEAKWSLDVMDGMSILVTEK